MDTIIKKINQVRQNQELNEPIIFDLKDDVQKKKLEALFEKGEVKHISDDYVEQLKELFAVQNPTIVYAPDFEGKFKDYLKSTEESVALEYHGKWVFFPWLSTVVHILDQED